MEHCPHGYGGFFKCPKGCHSKGPVQDYEDRDRDINYFLSRLEAHGFTNTQGSHFDKRKV